MKEQTFVEQYLDLDGVALLGSSEIKADVERIDKSIIDLTNKRRDIVNDRRVISSIDSMERAAKYMGYKSSLLKYNHDSSLDECMFLDKSKIDNIIKDLNLPNATFGDVIKACEKYISSLEPNIQEKAEEPYNIDNELFNNEQAKVLVSSLNSLVDVIVDDKEKESPRQKKGDAKAGDVAEENKVIVNYS